MAKKKAVKKSDAKATEEKMVTVFIMGKGYKVPAEATIMGAIEYAGYLLKRGAGCREGFCGACATVYRMPGDYKIYTGLACTTRVEEGMWLAQLPASPAHKAIYDIKKIKPEVATIQELYPEVFRCVACNSCSKACPQDLEVMDYIQEAKRGNIAAVMDLSFDCVMCGLCAIRCPAEIVQYNVGLLCKRLYGRYLAPESKELTKRIKEVKSKKFDKEFKELMTAKKSDLEKQYYDRDLES